MNDIIIRAMRPDDYGVMECLKQLSSDFIPEYELEDYYIDRIRSGIITLVALLDSKIIGTASMIIERKILHRGGTTGHIEDVAVLPEYQKLGVGKQLIHRLIAVAEGYDCYKILLCCSMSNLKFYESCGFKQSKEFSLRMNLK